MSVKALDSLATSVYCENLAMMLAAGISSEEAIDLLCEDAREGAFFAAASSVKACMAEGFPLAPAMEKSGYFPTYATDTIAAGEVAGRTESCLRSLSTYYAARNQLEQRLRSVVIYPTILLFLMAAILAVMVFAVLPIFTSVYESLSGDIATSTYSYIQAANIISWLALVVTIVVMVVFLFLVLMVMSDTKVGASVMRFLQKFPVTREPLRQIACAQFLSVLATFISSGINPDSAFESALKTVDNAPFAADCERCQESMRQGKSLSVAIYEERLFDTLYARMLISGAKSGQVESVLEKLSDLYYEDSQDRINALIGAFEPVLAGFLTITVGLSLVSIMLPLIGIMGGIG